MSGVMFNSSCKYNEQVWSFDFKRKVNEQINYLIKSYFPLIGQREILVHYNHDKGFFATIRDFSKQTTESQTNLFVKGVPEKLKQLNDVASYRKYFEGTYLLAVMQSGKTPVVEVREALNGGMKAKIPFQTGMALGSVIDGDSIEKMEKYVNSVSERDSYQEQMENTEKRLAELELKIKNRKKITKGQNDALISMWEKEIELLNNGIEQLIDKMTKTQFSDFPLLSNFHSGLVSPIDFQNSELTTQARGFDSLHYSSQYISMKEDVSEIHDKMNQSSISTGTSIGGGWMLWKAKASGSLTRSAADRVTEMKRKNIAEGVLVINADVTARQVKFFKKLSFDKPQLKTLLDIIKSKDQEQYKKYGISSDGKVYILTEAVLGGSFVALITFLSEDESLKDSKLKGRELALSTQAGLDGEVEGIGFHFGGNLGYQNASKSQNEKLRNSENLTINVEIFSQGALPTFSKELIEKEVFKHLDFNPSKFELSKKDKEIAKKMSSNSSKERQEAILERQIQLENANVAMINTLQKVETTKEEQAVHSPSSVMAAYESFAEKMIKDSDSGVPIGFNYTVLDEKKIEEILGDK